MKKFNLRDSWRSILLPALYAAAWLLLDVFIIFISQPDTVIGLLFSALWSIALASIAFMLPKLGGRIYFGIVYAMCLTWTLIQTGYHCVFGKLMWFRDFFYVSEGVGFLGDTLRTLPVQWWVGGILLIGLWVVLIWRFPKERIPVIPGISTCAVAILLAFLLPYAIFADGSNYSAIYHDLPNAKSSYSVAGIYHLTARDLWDHVIWNRGHEEETSNVEQINEIDAYFADRAPRQDNAMTARYVGKNVVLVLMESMDDFLITPEDTPTLYRMMDEGINFTQFYTPGYGTARTLNTEFCMNTGIYLPTEGAYVFDYLENGFDQSLASQLMASGYTAEVFHYNTPDFYSRGDLEPAVGYGAYHSYGDYIDPDL